MARESAKKTACVCQRTRIWKCRYFTSNTRTAVLDVGYRAYFMAGLVEMSSWQCQPKIINSVLQKTHSHCSECVFVEMPRNETPQQQQQV